MSPLVSPSLLCTLEEVNGEPQCDSVQVTDNILPQNITDDRTRTQVPSKELSQAKHVKSHFGVHFATWTIGLPQFSNQVRP